MDLVHRVAYRFMALHKRGDVEDLPSLLRTFQNIVDHLAKDEAEVLKSPDDYMTKINAGAAVRAAFSFVKRYALELLFLGILKRYQMDAKDRRVIERAAKTFAKTRMRRIKVDNAVETYLKALKEYRLFLEVAKRVIARGKLHEEEGSGTTWKAGPFVLVNTGGFSEQIMEDVARVVEKAANMLTAKGLSRVCYGDIQVTNTVGRSARILAFYLVNKDELYVRANLKGKQGPAIASIVHELGHRLHYKFLRSKDNEIKAIYKRIGDKNDEHLAELSRDSTKHPKPGDTLVEGRKTYRVVSVELHPRTWEQVVKLERVDDPKQKARITLKGWFGNQGELEFVTPYARTSYEENFAEMIAHYCLGTLPDYQVEMLKTVI